MGKQNAHEQKLKELNLIDENGNYNFEDETLTPNETTTTVEKGKNTIRVQFDFTYSGTDGVINDGESLTEPNMTMSVAQMVSMAEKGEGTKTPLYFNQMIPTFSDFTDVEAFRDSLEARLEQTKAYIENQKAEQEQKAAEEAAKAAEAAKNSETTKEANEGA